MKNITSYNNFIKTLEKYETDENTTIIENSDYSELCDSYLNESITLSQFKKESNKFDNEMFLTVPNNILNESINLDGILINEGIAEWGNKLKNGFSDGLEKVKKVSSKIIKVAWKALLSLLKAAIKKIFGGKITDKVSEIVFNILSKVTAFFDKFKKWLESSKFGKTYKMLIKIVLGMGASVGAGYAASNLGPVWAPILAKKAANKVMSKATKKVFDSVLYEAQTMDTIEIDIKNFKHFYVAEENKKEVQEKETPDSIKNKLKKVFDKITKFLTKMMKVLAKFAIGYFIIRLVLEIVKDLFSPLLNFIPDLPWSITKAFGVIGDAIGDGTGKDLVSQMEIPSEAPDISELGDTQQLDFKVENVTIPGVDENVSNSLDSEFLEPREIDLTDENTQTLVNETRFSAAELAKIEEYDQEIKDKVIAATSNTDVEVELLNNYDMSLEDRVRIFDNTSDFQNGGNDEFSVNIDGKDIIDNEAILDYKSYEHDGKIYQIFYKEGENPGDLFDDYKKDILNIEETEVSETPLKDNIKDKMSGAKDKVKGLFNKKNRS